MYQEKEAAKLREEELAKERQAQKEASSLPWNETGI